MAGNKTILNKRSSAVNADGTPKIPTSEQLQNSSQEGCWKYSPKP